MCPGCETAYAKKYQIHLSTDANTWTKVYQDDAGHGGVDDIELTGCSARHVKTYAWQRGAPWGSSLGEVEVSGR